MNTAMTLVGNEQVKPSFLAKKREEFFIWMSVRTTKKNLSCIKASWETLRDSKIPDGDPRYKLIVSRFEGELDYLSSLLGLTWIEVTTMYPEYDEMKYSCDAKTSGITSKKLLGGIIAIILGTTLTTVYFAEISNLYHILLIHGK